LTKKSKGACPKRAENSPSEEDFAELTEPVAARIFRCRLKRALRAECRVKMDLEQNKIANWHKIGLVLQKTGVA